MNEINGMSVATSQSVCRRVKPMKGFRENILLTPPVAPDIPILHEVLI